MPTRSWMTGRQAVSVAAGGQAVYFVLLALITLVIVWPKSAGGTAAIDLVFAAGVGLLAWFASRGPRWPLIVLVIYEPLNAISDVLSLAGSVHPSTPAVAIAIDLVITLVVLAVVVRELLPRSAQPLPKPNS